MLWCREQSEIAATGGWMLPLPRHYNHSLEPLQRRVPSQRLRQHHTPCLSHHKVAQAARTRIGKGVGKR